MKPDDLAKLVYRVFSSDDGQKLLQYLNTEFVYNSKINPKTVNIEFNSGFNEGQREVIKWINTQMANSQNLKS